jgi:hypothetical protein
MILSTWLLRVVAVAVRVSPVVAVRVVIVQAFLVSPLVGALRLKQF